MHIGRGVPLQSWAVEEEEEAPSVCNKQEEVHDSSQGTISTYIHLR